MLTNPSAFGHLLRRHRRAAGLSQQSLADRAELSIDAVRALERGRSGAPRAETLARLLGALGLEAEARAALTAAAWPDAAAPLPDDHPTLAADADPRTLASRQDLDLPFPLPLSSFVGRERERAAVRDLLERLRLVTLTGTGGVGKTRLALAVAEDLHPTYRDGVWLVELAALAEPGLVAGAVLRALGLQEEPGRPVLGTLTAFLHQRQLLLVLDNCEHLLAACTDLVGALLRAAPDLRILATSREALGVTGEQRYRVPSLSVPDPEQLPAVELVPAYEAVRLFVARAQERQVDFVLDAQTAPVVAAICARLDGIPLAIELAAARVGSLPLSGIAARLDERFGLLTAGPRDLPPRQQTLRATLLELGAADGAGAHAAGPAIGVRRRLEIWRQQSRCVPGPGVELSALLDLMAGLVNKSLVHLAERSARPARYGLLETVRQYAQEQLAAAGEVAAVRDRHLAWCLALAAEAEPQLLGVTQGTWLDRLEAEHGNLRAALGWAHNQGRSQDGLTLAGALWRFWFTRGYLAEGRSRMEVALDQAGPTSAAARAAALNGAGNLAFQQADYARAAVLYAEAVELRRALDDTRGLAASLDNLGNVAERQGEYARAAALHEDALTLRRALGDKRGIANSLGNLGVVAFQHGEYERAATLHTEVLLLQRELGDTYGIATALDNLGDVLSRLGDYVQARLLLDESLALRRELGDTYGMACSLTNLGFVAHMRGQNTQAVALQSEGLALQRELGDKYGIATSLNNLGKMAHVQGDDGTAAALLRESLLFGRDIGARELIAETLESLAWVAVRQGKPHRGAQFGGTAEILREKLGMPLRRDQQTYHDRAIKELRALLHDEAFSASWIEGRTMALDESIALALEPTD